MSSDHTRFRKTMNGPVRRFQSAHVSTLMLLCCLLLATTGCGQRNKAISEWNRPVTLNPGETAKVQILTDYGSVAVYNSGPGLLNVRSPSTGENLTDQFTLEPQGYRKLRIAGVRSLGFTTGESRQRVLFYLGVEGDDLLITMRGDAGKETVGRIGRRTQEEERRAQGIEEKPRSDWDEFLDFINPFDD